MNYSGDVRKTAALLRKLPHALPLPDGEYFISDGRLQSVRGSFATHSLPPRAGPSRGGGVQGGGAI